MGEQPFVIPATVEEAEAIGWVVNRSTYPWVAYYGATFDPVHTVFIDTPAYDARRPTAPAASPPRGEEGQGT